VKFILILIAFLLSSHAWANPPFTIPRSQVLHIDDPDTERRYSVAIKLPKNYEKNPQRHYPVIVLADAPYTFQITSGATRYPMNSGAMDHAILVGLGYEIGSVGSSSRIRDYTPSVAADWKRETGGAARYAAFLEHRLLPTLGKQFRIQPQGHTLAGHSLGGLFATYVLFHKPELFDNYIISSPSVWFKNEEALTWETVEYKTSKRVFLSVGEYERPAFGEGQDMVDGVESLAKKLAPVDSVSLRVEILAEAKHHTSFPTSIIQGLDWLYGAK